MQMGVDGEARQGGAGVDVIRFDRWTPATAASRGPRAALRVLACDVLGGLLLRPAPVRAEKDERPEH